MAAHSSILAWRIPIDRGTWRATVHGSHKELDMTERLSTAHKRKRSSGHITGPPTGFPSPVPTPGSSQEWLYFRALPKHEKS